MSRKQQRDIDNKSPLVEHQSQARIAALEAQVADLEAQLVAQRRLMVAVPNARLNTLLAISGALLTTREMSAVLRLVVRESINLFPGAIGALTFLVGPTGQTLELQATSSGPTMDLVLQPGQGVAGRAFLAPRAMLMVGPELEVALSELDETQRTTAEALLQPWPPLSALLAPLRIDGQRLGALVIYGGTDAHLFHPRDLPFVQALADLVAIAIAEMWQREHAAALQRDLRQTQSLHAEAQARLNSAQAQLLQSAKLAAVGELAATVAHEINNPLYAARNSLYLIQQDLQPGAPQQPFLDVAQKELGRIARIITRMRDFYRPTRAELEPTDINTVLAETVELIQMHLHHNSVVVVIDTDAKLPKLLAHADQIRQVLLNLMLNACDAMSNGGRLHVVTKALPATADEVGHIIIRVSDTGIGIPVEHLPRVFEPFYTTKPQGTGLGLAISAHIVAQHGGHITVDSTVGQGTTFTVVLPVPSEE